MYYYILYFDIIVSQQEELFWVSFERARTRFFSLLQASRFSYCINTFQLFSFLSFSIFFVTPFTLV